MLPFALFGLLRRCWRSSLRAAGRAAPARIAATGPSAGRRESPPPAAAAADRSRLATVLVLGGWFLVEAAVLSLSKGIVHPYYVSALAPGTGAMAGAGAVAFIELARGRHGCWGLALVACALATTADGAGRADAPRALHGVVRPRARRRRRPSAFGALLAMRRLAAPGDRARVPAAARRADGVRDLHVACAGRGHLPGRRTQSVRRCRRVRRQRTRPGDRSRAARLREHAPVRARAGRC